MYFISLGVYQHCSFFIQGLFQLNFFWNWYEKIFRQRGTSNSNFAMLLSAKQKQSSMIYVRRFKSFDRKSFQFIVSIVFLWEFQHLFFIDRIQSFDNNRCRVCRAATVLRLSSTMPISHFETLIQIFIIYAYFNILLHFPFIEACLFSFWDMNQIYMVNQSVHIFKFTKNLLKLQMLSQTLPYNLKLTFNPIKCTDVFILFQNRHLQYYDSSGSILALKGSQIVFISNKGLKTTLSMDSIISSKELSDLLDLCIELYNRYSTEHIIFKNPFNRSAEFQKLNEDKKALEMFVTKQFKIEFFQWENSVIQELQAQKNAFCIYSDSRYASLTLHSDLFRVTVKFLLLTCEIRSSSNKSNATKLLLQKYKYSYTDFPSNLSNQQRPSFQYVEYVKEFCIFNVPLQWKYPLYLLWQILIKESVFQHKFCYLEFTCDQMVKKTPMPTLSEAFHNLNIKSQHQFISSDHQFEFKGLSKFQLTSPALGLSKHHDKCLAIKIGSKFMGWMTQQGNILSDGYGFWTYQSAQSLVCFKKWNKLQIDYQYHVNAIPYRLKLPSEPQRSVFHEIKLFLSYIQQNSKKYQMAFRNHEKLQNSYVFNEQAQLLTQTTLQNVGNFKAYSNGLVYVKFVDGYILILNSKKMEAKIMSFKGQTFYANLCSPQSYSYKQFADYINYSIDFQEQIFNPLKWIDKQSLRDQIDSQIMEAEKLKYISSALFKQRSKTEDSSVLTPSSQ